MWRRVLSWMYSLCSLKTLSEIIYLPHQLQLKCVEGVSQAEICSLGCISWRTSLLSLQMVSKEACYKGPPFKTRFHELDGCQASGKAKNDARRSVAIASLVPNTKCSIPTKRYFIVKVAGSIHWWLAGGEGVPIEISHRWTQGIYLRKAQPNPACPIQPKPWLVSWRDVIRLLQRGWDKWASLTSVFVSSQKVRVLRKQESVSDFYFHNGSGWEYRRHIKRSSMWETLFFLKKFSGAQNFQYRTVSVWENVVGIYLDFKHLLNYFLLFINFDYYLFIFRVHVWNIFILKHLLHFLNVRNWVFLRLHRLFSLKN